jgi:hypothetical protein
VYLCCRQNAHSCSNSKVLNCCVLASISLLALHIPAWICSKEINTVKRRELARLLCIFLIGYLTLCKVEFIIHDKNAIAMPSSSILPKQPRFTSLAYLGRPLFIAHLDAHASDLSKHSFANSNYRSSLAGRFNFTHSRMTNLLKSIPSIARPRP